MCDVCLWCSNLVVARHSLNHEETCFPNETIAFHSSFTLLLALPVDKLSDYDKHQLPQVQSLLFLQKEFLFLIGGK
jgi:hypothetical protein